MLSTLKRYRAPLLLAFALAQLVFVLSMPQTKTAVVLWVNAVASGHYILYVLLAPCLLASGVVFNKKLKSLDLRWLEWSPFNVKANIALLPIKTKWVWLPYGLLLAACMPLLAMFEELIFRNGTTGWVQGALWGAVAFGLFHFLSFVTIRMMLYLCLVGAVFVQLYMLDGLLAVFVVHASYNLLALALLIAEQHLRKAPGLLRRASASVASASS